MNELWAALIGVGATTVVMAVGNNSSRKERDIRELFHRVNALEKIGKTRAGKGSEWMRVVGH